MLTRLSTGTATLVMYDLARLQHRVDDTCDWWSDPDEELAEVNQGNALFVSTGCDGAFEIHLVTSDPPNEGSVVVKALLKNDSGRFFVGAAEYVSGEGREPTAEHGSVFVKYPAG